MRREEQRIFGGKKRGKMRKDEVGGGKVRRKEQRILGGKKQ